VGHGLPILDTVCFSIISRLERLASHSALSQSAMRIPYEWPWTRKYPSLSSNGCLLALEASRGTTSVDGSLRTSTVRIWRWKISLCWSLPVAIGYMFVMLKFWSSCYNGNRIFHDLWNFLVCPLALFHLITSMALILPQKW
jgi:hypothetical protein